MKKTYLYAVLSVFSLLLLYYCSDENSINNPAESKVNQKLSYSNSAREAGDFNFIKGGDLELSAIDIQQL